VLKENHQTKIDKWQKIFSEKVERIERYIKWIEEERIKIIYKERLTPKLLKHI
jgi:hypothetical protein